jgi:hypothetical protein
MGHDRLAHVAVDRDLGASGGAKDRLDLAAVARRDEPKQLLVAVGQVVVLVGGDHRDRPADVGVG